MKWEPQLAPEPANHELTTQRLRRLVTATPPVP